MMNMMLYFLLSLSICLIMFLTSTVTLTKNHNKNKMNSFECGFTPLLKMRNPFSLQFFKILLIFLLFDMEIILILPLPLFKIPSNIFMATSSLIITFILLSVLIEWKEGSLEWLK